MYYIHVYTIQYEKLIKSMSLLTCEIILTTYSLLTD